MTLILYGSTTGNTEKIAKMLAGRLADDTDVTEVSELKPGGFDGYDTVLLGSSTWGLGDLQDGWEDKIELLEAADLSGKKVGFFGCGDQESYPDTFMNALGTLAAAVKDSGAALIGAWPVNGYSFSESSAAADGKFIGLAIDEDNQSDLTEARVDDWVKNL